MENNDNLNTIIQKQRQLLGELEEQYKVILESDINQENRTLTEQRDKITAQYDAIKNQLDTMQGENKELKNALFDYTYSDKLMLVTKAENRSMAYFQAANNQQENRLFALEKNIAERINSMKASISGYNLAIEDSIYKQIDEFSQSVSENIHKEQKDNSETLGVMAKKANEEYEQLRQEKITDEQIKSASKKNNIESFVGLNILNRVGMLLIIVGVFAASQFAYYRLTDTLKGVLIFSLGILMLAAGELYSRKKADVFSLGIIAGGVGVLYVGLGISFFNLKILSMPVALLLCVMITAVAFFLSTRHNSQVIAIFALIGGYLPLIPILDNRNMLFGSMVYFLLLNILLLVISFSRKWKVASFLGLVLNSIGTFLISNMVIGFYKETSTFTLATTLSILYVFISFAVYTAMPIISTKVSKSEFKFSDVIFVAFNTVASSVTLYVLLGNAGLSKLHGVLAIFFAVAYFIIAKVVERTFNTEKRMQALFYLTALAFVVLVIPLQFGIQWLSIGWLIEGVVIATYGILTKDNIFKRAGYAIYGLCIASFLAFDVFDSFYSIFFFSSSGDFFTTKYSFITLGSLVLLAAFIYKKELVSKYVGIFKNIVLANTWFYSMYIIFSELTYRIPTSKDWGKHYLMLALAVAVTFAIAFVINRIPHIRSKGTRVLSVILYIIGTLMSIYANAGGYSPYSNNSPMVYKVIGTFVIIILGAISLFAMYELSKLIVIQKKLGLNKIPLIISIYFLVILTQNLISHYGLSFSSMLISIVYAIMAFLWIYFGFVRQLPFMRRFGLALALLSVVKLFIIDLYSLTQGYRIISYFALGIALILISFVYQKFSKKLELQGSVIDDKKETV